MTVPADEHTADRSLSGKVRRRFVRLLERRTAHVRLPRAMISFSFDDAPTSAVTLAGKMLEQRGLRGTYFVSPGLEGQDSVMGRYATREELTAAAAAGHELGCHTYSHLDCGQADSPDIVAELEKSRATLMDWGVPAPESFAYPYGDVSRAAKRVAAGRFTVSRALHPGLVETGSDLNQTAAIGIEGPAGALIGRRWLNYAVARRAWLIFYTHDVRESPSPCGCTPDAFRELVDRARNMDCDIVTVAEGARRIHAKSPVG